MNYIGSVNEFTKFFEMHDNLIGNMHVFANGVMLGCTNGATVLDATPSYTDITCTQQGSTPADQIVSGTDYKLTVPVTGLAITTLAQMSPLVKIDPKLGKVVFSKGIGVSLKKDFPVHLVMAEADSDGAPDLSKPYAVFPLATVASPLQMNGSNDQRTNNLEFTIHAVNLDKYSDTDEWFKGKRIIGFTSHMLENAAFEFPQELIEKHLAYSSLQHDEKQMVITYASDVELSVENESAMVQVGTKLYAIDEMQVVDNTIVLDLTKCDVKMSSEVSLYLPMKHIYANGRPAAPIPMMLSDYKNGLSGATQTPPVSPPVVEEEDEEEEDLLRRRAK